MKVTKRQLRHLIREAIREAAKLPKPPPVLPEADLSEEAEYGAFARTQEVQKMLMDAGFNADGSFGKDGYPGPADWQMYSPENMVEAEGWIQAALDMNEALKEAEEALAAGEFPGSSPAQSAFWKIISPVQSKYSKHGAADTEPRNVAADWLEDAGYEW